MASYSKKYCDIHVIPDKHNTGCKGELIKWYNHPAFSGVSVAETTGCLYLSVQICNNVNNVFENIDFDNVYVQLTNNKINKTNLGSSEITFKNCYFKAWSGINSKGEKATANFCIQNQSDITVNLFYCTFYAPKSAANYIDDKSSYVIDHCLATMCQCDGFKVSTNVIIKNSYVNNSGADHTFQAHSDGVQFTSGSKFYIENFRSDCVAIGEIVSGANQTHVLNPEETIPAENVRLGNAGVYIDYESGENKILEEGFLKDIYINGGGYSIYTVSGDGYTLQNMTVDNYNYGCAYNYGAYNNGNNINYNWFNSDTTKEFNKAFVSSVWKENGSVKFLATNYTNEEKTLIVKTSNGSTYNFNLPKCPTGSEYYKVNSPLHNNYTSYEDFPFDIEFSVPDCSWIVIYDNSVEVDNQIRYENFTTREYETVEELMEDTCNAIREKTGETGLIYHTDIPSKIRLIETGKSVSSFKIVNGEIFVSNVTINNDSVNI